MVFNCLQQGWPSGQRVLENKVLLGPARSFTDCMWLPFSANSGVESLSQRPCDLQNLKMLALYTNGFLTPGCHFRFGANDCAVFLGWVSEGSPLVTPCSLPLLF